jgi:predicted secreted Zn-dependent protease
MRIRAFSALILGAASMVAGCKPSTKATAMKAPPGAITIVDSVIYYDVDGNNAAEVNRSIRLNGPTSNNANRWVAVFQHGYTFRDTYTPSPGGCNADVKFSARSKIVLPRWKMYANARPVEQRAWTTYVLEVKAHEELHRGIFLAGLDSAWQAANAETAPDCGELRPKVRAAISAAMRFSQNEQNKFDIVDQMEMRGWVPPS